MFKQLAGSSNISTYDIPNSTLFSGYAATQTYNTGIFGIFREQPNVHKDYYDKTKWTFSTWFKLAGDPLSPNSDSIQELFYTSYNDQNLHSPTVAVDIHTDRSMVFGFSNVGSWGTIPTKQGILKTKMKFLDFGAWYHVVAVFDSSYPVAEERMKLYINGVRVTEFDVLSGLETGVNIKSFYPLQNSITALGTCNGETINDRIVSESRIQVGFAGTMTTWIPVAYYSDTYMADTYLITGNVLDANDFGKFDPTTNQWVPIKYDMNKLTGSPYAASSFRINSNDDYNPADLYGTGTPFTLRFDMKGQASKLITDIELPDGVLTYKRFIDTPTNNVCCLDHNNKKGSTDAWNARNANILDMGINNGSQNKIQGTIAIPNSGKWCFFATMNPYIAGTDLHIGVVPYYFDMNLQGTFTGSIVIKNDGKVWKDGVVVVGQESNPIPWTDSNNVCYLGVFVDSDTNKVHFKYRTAEGGTYPTNVFSTPEYNLDAVEYLPFVSGKGAAGKYVATQFGEIPIQGHLFSWDQQGYKLLNSKNLPTPRIKIPNKYFKTYTWIGNGASQQIGELQKPLDLYDSGKSIIFSNNCTLNKTFNTVPSNQARWTFATWFRNTNPTVSNTILKATRNDSSYTISIGTSTLTGKNGTIIFKAMSNASTVQFQAELTGYTVQDCDWHHLAILYNASVGGLEFFIDGNLKNYQFSQGSSLLNVNTFNQQNQIYTIGGALNDIQLSDLYFLDGANTSDSTFCTTVDGNGYVVPKQFDGKDYRNVLINFGNNGFHFDWRNVTQSTPLTIGTPVSGQGDSSNWTVLVNNFSAYNFVSKDSPSNAYSIIDGDNKVSAETTSIYPLKYGNTVMGGYVETNTHTFNFSEYITTLKANTNNVYFEFLSETYNTYGTAQVLIWTKSYADAKREYLKNRTGNQTVWEFATTYAPNPLIAPTGEPSQDFGMYSLWFDSSAPYSLSFGRYGVCFDAKRGYLWVASIDNSGNGTWLDDKSPTDSPNDPYTKIPIVPNEEYYISGYVYRNVDRFEIAKLSFNFGQFDYKLNNIPLGFFDLCENNVKEITSDIESPYMLWIKSRNLTHGCRVFNKGLNYIDPTRPSVTGIIGYDSYDMATGTSVVTYQPEQVKSYNKNGFVVGNNEAVNSKNDSYVAWGWNNGIITGMDVKSFVASNDNTPIPHNLNVTPKVVFTKALTPVPNSNPLLIDGSSVNVRSSLFGNWAGSLFMGGQWDQYSLRNDISPLGTLPDSSNYYHNVPANYVGLIADSYLFSEVEGFSRFDTYVGNGANKFIYTGFRPAFILFKAMFASDNGYNTFINSGWTILDSARDKYNHTKSNIINPTFGTHTETHIQENVIFNNIDVYMYSNGFKMLQNNQNQNNWTYFFMAFAESPFKYSNAR